MDTRASNDLTTTRTQGEPQAIRLTDDQCDAFRRLPCGFNDMVRAIYRAGYIIGRQEQAGTVEPLRATARTLTDTCIRIVAGTPCAYHAQPENAPLEAFLTLADQCGLCNAEHAAAFAPIQPRHS